VRVKSSFVSRDSDHCGYNFWALTGKLLPGVIFLVVFLVYLVPNSIEALLVRHGAPAVALTVLGDLAGCAVIAVVLNIRWALGVYLVMSGIEFALLRYGQISPVRLTWITNVVPTAIVGALIVYAAWGGRNWRSSSRSSQPALEMDR